jgi:hypothetical protein
MMDPLGVLAYSGPVPLEDLVWLIGDTPSAALGQIIALSEKGLVLVTGLPLPQLRGLAHELAAHPSVDQTAALERLHTALANTKGTVELTRDGLRVAPATA